MEALRDIEQRFMRASLSAVVIVVILALSGSVGFRRLVDARATSIRRTLQQVANGELGPAFPCPSGTMNSPAWHTTSTGCWTRSNS
jgi:hypothetical protein